MSKDFAIKSDCPVPASDLSSEEDRLSAWLNTALEESANKPFKVANTSALPSLGKHFHGQLEKGLFIYILVWVIFSLQQSERQIKLAPLYRMVKITWRKGRTLFKEEERTSFLSLVECGPYGRNGSSKRC
ncbi:hypothetical protein SAPIO_CDS3767 [Scedosporium apiospermum]|uniref:Uncharacterized protein n=1 Tax=Pseudallescheria apiosperma TaxID=563466 RepID=A0A084G9M4_PSEDA|nr:uncharacterized protein SAPIO_CDS3767 [Scedosporium apiospermum]KEZ44036.1 hypothetical protein SAPIO_CDS3767 [Scedosporium apiospermum]